MIDGVPQLTFRGPRAGAGSESVEAIATEFRERRCAVIPGLIEPSLLEWIQRQIATGELRPHTHHGIESNELQLRGGTCLGVLTFLVNDPEMLRFVERVTGVPTLTRFLGRVYSRVPGVHADEWHDDLSPDRLVGLSINLSAGLYSGGVFEIREAETLRPLGSIANTGFGDAILFPIGEELQHRISPLEGHVAKTAFAGWFGASLDYNAELRRDPALTDE